MDSVFWKHQTLYALLIMIYGPVSHYRKFIGGSHLDPFG